MTYLTCEEYTDFINNRGVIPFSEKRENIIFHFTPLYNEKPFHIITKNITLGKNPIFIKKDCEESNKPVIILRKHNYDNSYYEIDALTKKIDSIMKSSNMINSIKCVSKASKYSKLNNHNNCCVDQCDCYSEKILSATINISSDNYPTKIFINGINHNVKDNDELKTFLTEKTVVRMTLSFNIWVNKIGFYGVKFYVKYLNIINDLCPRLPYTKSNSLTIQSIKKNYDQYIKNYHVKSIGEIEI